MGFDPWFPLSGPDDLGAAAKRICAACEVKDDCLDVALKYGEDYGIWGGLTAVERRGLKARIPRPAEPADDGRLHKFPTAT
ncbi:WhiB family transcriptional regulator [Glycomyces halotolerans]